MNESSEVPKNKTNPPEQTDAQIIKAKPLTIKKQAFGEQPKLRNPTGAALKSRRIEMPPAFHFPEPAAEEKPPTEEKDVTDRATTLEDAEAKEESSENVVRR